MLTCSILQKLELNTALECSALIPKFVNFESTSLPFSFSLPSSFICVGWRKPKCSSSSSEVSRLSHKIRPTHTLCGSSGWVSVWRWCSEGIDHYRGETWHFAAWPKCDWCNTKYDFDWSSHNLSKLTSLYTHSWFIYCSRDLVWIDRKI